MLRAAQAPSEALNDATNRGQGWQKEMGLRARAGYVNPMSILGLPLTEILINGAYVIFLVAIIVKDILWLRIIMTIASFCFVGYAFLVESRSMQAWNVLFTAINVFQIVRILRERRPVVLSPELKEIYADCFRNMNRRDFLNFWHFGAERELTDSLLCRQGEAPGELYYLLDGEAEILVDGRSVGRLGRLNLVGEMSILTRRDASADVRTVGRARVRAWSRQALEDLAALRPGFREMIRVSMGQDLAQKLARRAASA